MNSFVITRELAALRRDELLAEAARDRLARPAQCQAIAEPTRLVAERLNHPATDAVGSCLP